MDMASRTGTIEAVCLSFIVAVLITSVLRVISRTRSKAGLSWDDYLSFLAAVRMHMRKLSFEGFLDLEQKLMSTTQIFVIGLNCLVYAGMTSN